MFIRALKIGTLVVWFPVAGYSLVWWAGSAITNGIKDAFNNDRKVALR